MTAELAPHIPRRSGAFVGFLAGLAVSGAAYLGLKQCTGSGGADSNPAASVGMDPDHYMRFFSSVGFPARFTTAVYAPSPLITGDADEFPPREGQRATMPARQYFLFAPRIGVKEGRNTGPSDRRYPPLEPLMFACPQRVTFEQVETQLLAVTEVGQLLDEAGIHCFGEWTVGIEDAPSRISFQFPHGDIIRDAEIRFSIESDNPLRLTPYIQIGDESFTPKALADIARFMAQREGIAFETLQSTSTGLQRHAATNAVCEWHLGVEQRGHSLILIQNMLQRFSNGRARAVSSAVFQSNESPTQKRFEGGVRFTPHVVTGFEVVTEPSDYFIVRYRRAHFPESSQFEITHCADGELFLSSTAQKTGQNDSLSEPWRCTSITPLQPLSTKGR